MSSGGTRSPTSSRLVRCQTGRSSAVPYCVYTNDLFKALRRLNIGCCIGQNYVGIIGYADDLFLMSPSLDGLQKIAENMRAVRRCAQP